jgi:hypothetical protein
MRQLRVSGALKGPSHQSINVALEIPLEEFHRQSFGAASAIPENVNSCASDNQGC